MDLLLRACYPREYKVIYTYLIMQMQQDYRRRSTSYSRTYNIHKEKE